MGSIVLLSGGLDSTVLAERERERDKLRACVFVDYGQPPAEQEHRAAAGWCGNHGCPLVVFSLSGMPLDSMQIGVGVSGPRVMPGRNAALISCAVSAAVRLGESVVLIGATAADQDNYPDCRPAFIAAMDALMRVTYGVGVAAPLSHLDRKAIKELAERYNVGGTWSCYEPTSDGQPCGVCDSCRQ